MKLLDNFLIITCIVAAFTAGVLLANRYHNKAEQEKDYALRRLAAYKHAGLDYYDSGPYVAPPIRQPLGQQFMDTLREKGRAVQQIGQSQQK